MREAQAPNVARYVESFATIPYDVTHNVTLPPPSPHPEALTLVTSAFLHASVPHIFFNMLFLLVFGPAIERSFGSVRFVLFYVFCAVIANLTQVLATPNSHLPEIGASGAVAGVLGAYLVMYPANSIQTVVPIGCFPLFLRVPAVVMIGVWAVLQFVHGFGTIDPRTTSEQGVAYFAHIGGFLSGALIAPLLRRRPARG